MTIQSLDTQLLLLINHGTENTLFDILMPALSYQGYLLVLPFLFYMFVRGRTQVNSEGKGYLNSGALDHRDLLLRCLSCGMGGRCVEDRCCP